MPAVGLIQPQVQAPDLGKWVVVLKDHNLSIVCRWDLPQRGVTKDQGEMCQTSATSDGMEVGGE